MGWRLWIVVGDGGYLWLESVLYAVRWSPRRLFDAVCIPHRRCYFCDPAEVAATPIHRAPADECECGVYGAREPDTLAPYLDSPYPGRSAVERVLGRVRLWGKVIECERGWRAEHAYPEQIYVPNRLTPKQEPHKALQVAAGLRDYGVRIVLLPSRTTPETITRLEKTAA